VRRFVLWRSLLVGGKPVQLAGRDIVFGTATERMLLLGGKPVLLGGRPITFD
jgi:hypothetical protein